MKRADLQIKQITNCPYCNRVNTVKAISPELTVCDGCRKEYKVQPYSEIMDEATTYIINVNDERGYITPIISSLLPDEYDTIYYAFKDWNERLGFAKFKIEEHKGQGVWID